MFYSGYGPQRKNVVLLSGASCKCVEFSHLQFYTDLYIPGLTVLAWQPMFYFESNKGFDIKKIIEIYFFQKPNYLVLVFNQIRAQDNYEYFSLFLKHCFRPPRPLEKKKYFHTSSWALTW